MVLNTETVSESVSGMVPQCHQAGSMAGGHSSEDKVHGYIEIELYLMFYAQSTVKGHIRANQNVEPQVKF